MNWKRMNSRAKEMRNAFLNRRINQLVIGENRSSRLLNIQAGYLFKNGGKVDDGSPFSTYVITQGYKPLL